MTTENALASAPPALDTRTLLARVNARIALLRTWISHSHRDEPYWWARRTTAPQAQSMRESLRHVADLLHVERATSRGRVHGTRFATLDEQRAWLQQHEAFPIRLDGVAVDVTLIRLREGKLPL